jgi:hypothetical protein
MQNFWEILGLNNREIAVLFWTVVFLFFVRSALKTTLPQLLKSFLAGKVISVFLILGMYTAALCWVLKWLDLWDTTLIKDTTIWYFAAGCSTIFQAADSSKTQHLFKKIFLDTLKLTVVIEFLLEKFVLPFLYEMLLVPIIGLLAAIIAVAGTKKEFLPVQKLAQTLFNVLALTLLLSALYGFFSHYTELQTANTLHEFLLAPFLTIATIPFFFAFSLLCAHEQLAIRMEAFTRHNPELTRYAKREALLASNLSLRKLRKLSGGQFANSIMNAKTQDEIGLAISTAIKNEQLPESM